MRNYLHVYNWFDNKEDVLEYLEDMVYHVKEEVLRLGNLLEEATEEANELDRNILRIKVAQDG